MSPSPLPGRALVHPWALVAAGALVFNVFWLRRRHPGAVSGKLSDVAIGFLLPLFLAAVVEWCLALGRWLGARRLPAALGARGIVAVCAVSALYFLLLKAWPGFTPVHRALLGAVARPLGIAWRFRNIADPTDLVALAMVPLAGWHLRACAERGLGAAAQDSPRSFAAGLVRCAAGSLRGRFAARGVGLDEARGSRRPSRTGRQG